MSRCWNHPTNAQCKSCKASALACQKSDLNPTEHVWDLLKRRLRALPQQQNNKQLAQTIAQVWNGIPQRYLQRYILSMRSRYRAVIAANGSHTRYWNLWLSDMREVRFNPLLNLKYLLHFQDSCVKYMK